MNQNLIQEFKRIVGADNTFADPTDLHTYSYDAAVVDSVRPALAVRPTTTEALGRCVGLCNRNALPLTVRGSGTNLSGGTIPLPGGVVVVTNGLNRILEINEADMYAVVQPGVITARLASAVEAKGLFYPPDPGSQAVSTLGGNVAENAGGLRGLKYGVTRDYVMGVNFFDVNGDLVKSGSRTVKCATGYNLTGLMTGSEGTLGVFAEIILKLIPYPKHSQAMMAVFDHPDQASETVSAIIAGRIVPATLEFLDNFTIRTVEAFSRAGLPTEAAAMLLIEMDGHPAQVEEEAAKAADICRAQGASSIRVAGDAAERDKVWAARRGALSALAKLKPTLVLEDATVPRSKIPAMVRSIQDIAGRYGLDIGVFGHAGDGNLHPTILTDKRDKKEWERVERAIDDIFDEALKLGGTLSGEHGTGIAKSRYLENETTPGTILWSSKMKKALDPNNILNPGKIIGMQGRPIMTQMNELVNLMRQLEDRLTACMKCGVCQSVCPLYDQTGKESDVARGKLALLEGLTQSMFQDPEGVYERLNKCLLCGSCAANCPSGVKVLEIFMKARAILTGYMGLSPMKRLALRGMLANPRLFDRLAEWGAGIQRLFTRPVNEVIGSSCARLASPLPGDRHFTALASPPFHRRVPSLDRPAGRSGIKVLLFTGCLIDKLYPDIGEATLKVLDYLDVGVFLPDNQACCGIPAISGGDLKTFRHLVLHNLERFNSGSFDYLVTSCATCTSTIREVWPKMAGPDFLERTRDLAEKTMDINQFLVRKNLLSPLPDPGGEAVKATYHDPCHLKKSLNVSAEPRQVISANPSYELVEMPEADWCCGMGGSFNLQYYGISKNIGRRKAENILSTGASVATSGCPACMAQISDILSQLGASIAVKHPIQLYAEGISKHEAAFKTGKAETNF